MPLTITVRHNGPLLIAPEEIENVRLVDQDGNVITPNIAPGKPMRLCRCGASTKKPFCDGTHSKIGFVAAEAARVEFDASRAASPAVPQGDGADVPPAATPAVVQDPELQTMPQADATPGAPT